MKKERIQGNHPMELTKINKEIWALSKHLLQASITTFKIHITKLKTIKTSVFLRVQILKFPNNK
jgi:hypothetical protein